MPVFARQLGFSTFVVGTIYSILPILGLVSKPLFGALADRYVYKNFLRFFLVRLRFTCKKKTSTRNESLIRTDNCAFLAISVTNRCSSFLLF